MAEYSVMDRINMIISDPDHATMTLAQIVTEEIREFKASEQYAKPITETGPTSSGRRTTSRTGRIPGSNTRF